MALRLPIKSHAWVQQLKLSILLYVELFCENIFIKLALNYAKFYMQFNLFQLLSQDQNVGVNYEYSVPQTSAPGEPDTYTWTFTVFDKCSVSCGGGHQSRNVTCKGQLTMQTVDPKLCDASQKPAEWQKCGAFDCPAQWVEGEWGKCSAPCGQNGTRERKVHCEVVKADG